MNTFTTAEFKNYCLERKISTFEFSSEYNRSILPIGSTLTFNFSILYTSSTPNTIILQNTSGDQLRLDGVMGVEATEFSKTGMYLFKIYCSNCTNDRDYSIYYIVAK